MKIIFKKKTWKIGKLLFISKTNLNLLFLFPFGSLSHTPTKKKEGINFFNSSYIWKEREKKRHSRKFSQQSGERFFMFTILYASNTRDFYWGFFDFLTFSWLDDFVLFKFKFLFQFQDFVGFFFIIPCLLPM